MSIVVFVPGNIVGKKLYLNIHFPLLKQWGVFVNREAVLVVIPSLLKSDYAESFLFPSVISPVKKCF